MVFTDVDDNAEILIGEKNGERVSIRRLTRNSSEHWFEAEVQVRCDGWQGKLRASFMQGELSRYADEVLALYDQLDRKATLSPLEPYLTLCLTGDGKGHIAVNGTARNTLGGGTELSFHLDLDQTYLPIIARALQEVDLG